MQNGACLNPDFSQNAVHAELVSIKNFSSTASMSQIKKQDFCKFSAAVRSNGGEQHLVVLNRVLERPFSFLAMIKKLREDSGEAFLKLFKRKSLFKETEVFFEKTCNLQNLQNWQNLGKIEANFHHTRS
jgi:hypothetical protein